MADNNALWPRLTLLAAGLIGAIGVMAAAGASHSEASRNLAGIAAIGLAHGPALLALGLGLMLAGRRPVLSVAAALLGLGTLGFIGDLAMREYFGQGLFPGAAPLAGGGMILGWLAVAVAGVSWRRG